MKMGEKTRKRKRKCKNSLQFMDLMCVARKCISAILAVVCTSGAQNKKSAGCRDGVIRFFLQLSKYFGNAQSIYASMFKITFDFPFSTCCKCLQDKGTKHFECTKPMKASSTHKIAEECFVSLLLFSASHAQLARKIAAQASHNHDNVGIHHDISSTGHKSFSVAPTTTTTATSSPHLEMVKDTDGDEESYITNSSSSLIIADLPANATRSLLSNSFTCPQAFFLFGDSLTDTGNIQLLAPGLAATTLNYPYGESYTFTNEPGHNRYSDGRLIVDFIAQAFGFPFFEPILLELDNGFQTDYTHGVNFAYSGATIQPDITKNPIYLQLELDQFFVYKEALFSSPQPSTPLSFLPTAAYLIPEMGGNDLFYAYFRGASPQTVIDEIVPHSLNLLVSAVEQLHESGARTIIVGNQPTLGCSPSILTAFSGSGPYDSFGCLDEYNKVSQVFNVGLEQALTNLQENYKADGTLIIQFDFYNAIIELFTNPAQYGFNPNTKLEVCCGFGGAYNYNLNVSCGDSGNVSLSTGGTQFVNINTTLNPKEYIEWDGVHFTQAVYKAITSFFLSGQFVISPPGFSFKQLCNLDFSQF